MDKHDLLSADEVYLRLQYGRVQNLTRHLLEQCRYADGAETFFARHTERSRTAGLSAENVDYHREQARGWFNDLQRYVGEVSAIRTQLNSELWEAREFKEAHLIEMRALAVKEAVAAGKEIRLLELEPLGYTAVQASALAPTPEDAAGQTSTPAPSA